MAPHKPVCCPRSTQPHHRGSTRGRVALAVSRGKFIEAKKRKHSHTYTWEIQSSERQIIPNGNKACAGLLG